MQRSGRLFGAQDLQHVFGRQRFEIEPVRRIVIRRDGLRIAVDHDGFVACITQGKCGMAAAIVELDALANAVRTAAEDDDFLSIGDLRFGGERAGEWHFIGRVHVSGRRSKFGGAGIDALEDRMNIQLVAQLGDFASGSILGEAGKARIGKAHGLSTCAGSAHPAAGRAPARALP